MTPLAGASFNADSGFFLGGVVWPGAIALVVTLVASPIVRRVATAFELYDRPDAGLKPHQKPIPYLGGTALYVGWLAGLLTVAVSCAEARGELLWVVLGATVMMLTGLIDDIRHIRPRFRLLIQAVVACLLLAGGVGRTVADALLAPLWAGLPEWMSGEPVVFGVGCVFWVVILAGATNATNLIDGLDGLCAGIVAIACLGFVLMCLFTGPPAARDDFTMVRLALSAATVGACIGFLRHNFNPAKMFMGDSGSLLLGFNVAVLMILFAELGAWRWFAGSLLVFAFPILDTALAITRRWLNDKPLFVGDRSHFYDQLRDRGLSVRQTVLLCYGLGVVFAALGAVIPRLSAGWMLAVLAGCLLAATVACLRLGMFRVDDAAERSRQQSDAATQ